MLRQNDDVAFVGNAYVEVSDDMNIRVLGGVCPPYRVYDERDRSAAITEILKNTYYNSLFHYERVDFLKETGVDFFEPYYGDCGGMTAVMCKAKKIVTFDKVIYLLSMNTSQTYGKYTWDFYRIISGQWQMVKEVFESENYTDDESVRYVAEKIFDNLVGHIDILMNSGICRDRYMNPMDVSAKMRIDQVKNMLDDRYIDDLFEYLGQQRLREALAETVANFAPERKE